MFLYGPRKCWFLVARRVQWPERAPVDAYTGPHGGIRNEIREDNQIWPHYCGLSTSKLAVFPTLQNTAQSMLVGPRGGLPRGRPSVQMHPVRPLHSAETTVATGSRQYLETVEL